MTSDEELLQRWAQGDTKSGDDLFRRHVDKIFRFFDRRVPAEAEELVQATFVGAVEAQKRFRGDAPFRAFLFAIARRQLMKFFDKQRGRDLVSLRTMSFADLGTSMGTRLVRDRQRQQLLEALAQLPADHQLAVELHYWEGLTTREVGAALECPPGTVKRWLFEARKKLGGALELADGELLERPEGNSD